MAKQRTLDLDGKGLESRITLDSEAHGISENRKKGTEDLALKMTYYFNSLGKSKYKIKKREREKKRTRKQWLELCALKKPRKEAISLNKQTQNP